MSRTHKITASLFLVLFLASPSANANAETCVDHIRGRDFWTLAFNSTADMLANQSWTGIECLTPESSGTEWRRDASNQSTIELASTPRELFPGPLPPLPPCSTTSIAIPFDASVTLTAQSVIGYQQLGAYDAANVGSFSGGTRFGVVGTTSNSGNSNSIGFHSSNFISERLRMQFATPLQTISFELSRLRNRKKNSEPANPDEIYFKTEVCLWKAFRYGVLQSSGFKVAPTGTNTASLIITAPAGIGIDTIEFAADGPDDAADTSIFATANYQIEPLTGTTQCPTFANTACEHGEDVPYFNVERRAYQVGHPFYDTLTVCNATNSQTRITVADWPLYRDVLGYACGGCVTPEIDPASLWIDGGFLDVGIGISEESESAAFTSVIGAVGRTAQGVCSDGINATLPNSTSFDLDNAPVVVEVQTQTCRVSRVAIDDIGGQECVVYLRDPSPLHVFPNVTFPIVIDAPCPRVTILGQWTPPEDFTGNIFELTAAAGTLRVRFSEANVSALSGNATLLANTHANSTIELSDAVISGTRSVADIHPPLGEIIVHGGSLECTSACFGSVVRTERAAVSGTHVAIRNGLFAGSLGQWECTAAANLTLFEGQLAHITTLAPLVGGDVDVVAWNSGCALFSLGSLIGGSVRSAIVANTSASCLFGAMVAIDASTLAVGGGSTLTGQYLIGNHSQSATIASSRLIFTQKAFNTLGTLSMTNATLGVPIIAANDPESFIVLNSNLSITNCMRFAALPQAVLNGTRVFCSEDPVVQS